MKSITSLFSYVLLDLSQIKMYTLTCSKKFVNQTTNIWNAIGETDNISTVFRVQTIILFASTFQVIICFQEYVSNRRNSVLHACIRESFFLICQEMLFVHTFPHRLFPFPLHWLYKIFTLNLPLVFTSSSR